jgi:hypothetical protein
MGESIRCPLCGWIGATRTASLCEYSPMPVRKLVTQTDTFECNSCRGTWDEETFHEGGTARRARRVTVLS